MNDTSNLICDITNISNTSNRQFYFERYYNIMLIGSFQ